MSESLTAPPAAPTGPAAVAGSRRITGVDLARGIALIGMAATHMLAVQDEFTGHLTGVGWLAAGRASSLFAVLAGVSLALVTGGQQPKGGADRARASVAIGVRAVIIGCIGLWLAGIGSPVAVILAYYAVLFVLALPFLGLRTPALAVTACAWAVLSPVVSHLWRQSLPEGPNAQVSFATLLEDPVAALRELFLIGYYPVLPWLTYVVVGLAIGRLDLRAARTAVRLVVLGVALAAAAWVTSAILLSGAVGPSRMPPSAVAAGWGWWDLASSEGYGTTPTDAWGWLLVAAPHTSTPLDLIGTAGSAMAVLGLCLLLTRFAWVRTLSRPVAAAGSMTLTLYTIHVVALAQPWGEWDSVPYYLTHVVVALVFATLWLHRLPRGPLEGLVHTVSTGVAAMAVPRAAPPAASAVQPASGRSDAEGS